MIQKKLLNSSIFCLALWFVLPTAASVSPSIEWKVLKLSHFRLIYDAKQQKLAEIYAQRLEAHTETLKRIFPEIPKNLTFVINDNTDETNGFSTPFPYQMIQIFPVPPGPYETIGEYGDWAYELSIHELAHSLQFAPRSSFNSWLHFIFGSWVTPNMLLPRWLLEGQAVDIETRFSKNGRLRSTFQDASIRALVGGGAEHAPQLGDINEVGIPTYPYGGRPYLWGSLLTSHMNDLAGSPEWMGEQMQRYGGRIPYFLNGPAEDKFQKTYSDLLSEMYFDLSGKVAAQLSHLRKVPTTKFKATEFKNFKETAHPLISPDGKSLIFLSRGPTLQTSLSVYQRTSGSPSNQKWKGSEVSTPASGRIARACWFSDSRRVLFDQLTIMSIFEQRSDLFIFDHLTSKKQQITFGLRAREACPSPNGKQAAYVQLRPGKTELGLLNLETKSTRILFATEYQDRVSLPVFANNNEILFVLRKNGVDTIQKYNLSTESVSQLLGPQKEIKFLNFENGKVIYSSSANGVPNLYQIDFKTRQLLPLTHSETGVLSGSYDQINSEWLTTVMTENGLAIQAASRTPQGTVLPAVEPLLANRYPPIAPAVESSLKLPEPKSYWALPYLIPRYWFPAFSASTEGTQLGFNTGSIDPLGKHAYDLTYIYETKTNDQDYIFTYINQSFTPTLFFSTYQLEQTSPQSAFVYKSKVLEGFSRWDLRSLWTDLTFDIGAYSQSDELYQTNTPVSLGRVSGAQIHFQRFSTLKSGELISQEKGYDFKVGAKYFKPTDRETNSFETYFNFQKYFSRWLPDRHAFLFQATGSYVDHPEPSTRWKYSTLQQSLPTLREVPPLMRGYPTGTFWGPSFFNPTVEYRFPLLQIFNGDGKIPLYLNRLHGALFADGIHGKLRAFVPTESAYEFIPQWQSIWNVGAELRLDTTLGNVLPVQFRLGLAKPLTPRYSEDTSQFYLTTGF